MESAKQPADNYGTEVTQKQILSNILDTAHRLSDEPNPDVTLESKLHHENSSTHMPPRM